MGVGVGGVLAGSMGGVAGCGKSGRSGGGGRKGLRKASFMLNYTPNAEHAAYYLGRKKGFYADSGIDLQIEPGKGSAQTAKVVGSGSAMFGVAVSDALVVARSQNVPLKALAVLLQQNPTVLVALKKSGIAGPKDLYGKKVGVDPASTINAFWQAFLKINKLDRSKIKEVNVGGNVVPALISGTVDATGVILVNEVVTLQQEGHPLNILRYSDFGVRAYGETLFANDTILKEDPKLVRDFVKASLRSWRYALEHVDEAVSALAAAVPQTNAKTETAKFKPIKELIKAKGPDGTTAPLGTMTSAGWRATYKTFKLGGVIEHPFDPTDLFTLDYVKG